MFLPADTIIAVGPVIIENNKVLLNREIKSDGEQSPYFMFPGGTMDNFDETLIEVCQKEIKEELGINIEIIKPLETLWVKRPGKDTYAILVHYLAKRIGEINPGPETIEWDWFDINNLPQDCAPNVYKIIADYKNML